MSKADEVIRALLSDEVPELTGGGNSNTYVSVIVKDTKGRLYLVSAQLSVAVLEIVRLIDGLSRNVALPSLPKRPLSEVLEQGAFR